MCRALLTQVDVFNPATQRTYTFPCNAWLEKTKEEDMDGCRKELFFGAAGNQRNAWTRGCCLASQA